MKNIIWANIVLFSIAGVLHLLRVIMQWPLNLGDFTIPYWLSIALVVLLGVIIFFNVKSLKNQNLQQNI